MRSLKILLKSTILEFISFRVNVSANIQHYTYNVTCNRCFIIQRYHAVKQEQNIVILMLCGNRRKCHISQCRLLTHWGRVTPICVIKLNILGSDNGLSPSWRQAIIWSNAGVLSIGSLGTNFCEISIHINIFSFKKIHLIWSSAKWRPFCLDLNVLTGSTYALQI